MNKISLVINTLNEEKNISDCINSAKHIVDEIIVCDMYSDDNTVSIAQSLGAKVVFHERIGFVEPARNYAITQATYEWILVLDADERMTEALALELKKIAQSDSIDLVLVAILYNYFGEYIRHGGFFKNSFPRFFKKEQYLKVYSNDEEMIHHNFINLKKLTEKQIALPHKYYIIHEAYPSFEKFLRKGLCNYTLIESKSRHENGETVCFRKVLFVPIKEFLIRYFIFRGFKEGKVGFILCYLKSQHTFYTLLNIWFLERR